MLSQVLIYIIILIATLPVWRWYGQRIFDGSDEPWGIFALLTMFIFACSGFGDEKTQQKKANLMLPSLLLIAYALAYPFLPQLLRAAIAMTALSAAVYSFNPSGLSRLGYWGLAMLSLPLIASLQFYIGFPLRVMVGEAAVFLLRFAGHDVFRQGVGLVIGDVTVSIDAPCSGIKMLWAGGYLVCTLACIWQMNSLRTILAGFVGIAIIIFGNIIRAASLFYSESGIVSLPSWAHTTIGIISFILTAFMLVAFMSLLKQKEIQAV